MSAPRPIKGSVGSRVRLVFGATGEDWLLLLNADNGNRAWQTHRWSGDIPTMVTAQLNNCSDEGRYVREVDFDHDTGSWFVNSAKRNGTGDRLRWKCPRADKTLKEFVDSPRSVKAAFGRDACREESFVLVNGRDYVAFQGIHQNLASRLSRLYRRNKKINFVRLFGKAGYFISDEEGTESYGCGESVENCLKASSQTEDVAVAYDGSWVIFFPNHYVCSTGVSQTLTADLDCFYREQKERNSLRGREIRDRIRRERQERVAQEALVERLRERAAREEAERVAREEAERASRQEVERTASERAVQCASEQQIFLQELLLEEAKSVKELMELQNRLEERLIEEAEAVTELETHLEKRKRALQSRLEKLPAARRAVIQQRSSTASLATSDTGSATLAACVVCRDRAKVRAVIPCGHHCLCDQCVRPVASSGNKCPVCRVAMRGTIRIYMS